jgi:hypothetical protein
MAETAVVNQIFEKTMEGITPECRAIVEEGLRAFAKDTATNPMFTDKVKCERLRKGFDSLTRNLVDRKLDSLNDQQMLFLCTGALADEVKLESKPGEPEIVAKLLPRDLYDALMAEFKKTPELPEEMDYILPMVDRARFIAMGELFALDPQQAGKRRPKPAPKQGGDTKAQKEMALGKKNQLVKELGEGLPALQKLFAKYLVGNKLAAKDAIDSMTKYYNQVTGKEAPAPLQADREVLDKKVIGAGPALATFSEENAQVLIQMKDLAAQLGPKTLELRKAVNDLEGLSSVVSEALRKKFVSYDVDKISLIKRDFEYTGSFVGRTAESAPQRVATSGSRILLSSHLDPNGNPLKDQICTPDNVHQAMQKILKIHTNLFPLNAAGQPVIPPIIIEPVRNVVEWMDDRFVISLVSGDPVKKGPQFSLTPVEAQVLRACGNYLSKDSLFNFRGEQNVGTFMGDYSGKIEKQAKVVFAGADKKMTMVASSNVLDSAGRDQAVTDYMDFIFNVKNGLGPGQKMSKRRVAVLLRYMVFENLQTTVILLLRYAGLTEIAECRETILKHTQNKYDEAKKLVENSWTDTQVPKILGDKPQQFMAKMFA